MLVGLADGIVSGGRHAGQRRHARSFLPKVVVTVMAFIFWLCLPWILQEMTGVRGPHLRSNGACGAIDRLDPTAFTLFMIIVLARQRPGARSAPVFKRMAINAKVR